MRKHHHVNGDQGRQSGQIFPVGLLFIGLLASLVLFYGKHAIDVNRVHHQQNLADAVALSAATWRARALNFNAFANRALIAQEVYAAHLTEANAWAAYARLLAERGQELSSIFPSAQAAAQAMSHLVSVDTELLRQISELELFARTAPGIGLNDQLAAAQLAFLRSADGFGLSAVANEVVRAADSDAFAHLVAGDRFSLAWKRVETELTKVQDRSLAWSALSGHPVSTADADNLTPTSHASIDQIAPIPTLNCIPKSLKQLTARLVRESVLSRLDSGWRSSQTLSLHGWQRGSFLPVCGSQREQIPIAWSQVSAGSEDLNKGFDKAGEHRESRSSPAWYNPQAQQRAQAEAEELEGYHGAGKMTRISAHANAEGRHPMRVLVAVTIGRAAERTKRLGAAWVVHQDQLSIDSESVALWLFPNWVARISVPTENERKL